MKKNNKFYVIKGNLKNLKEIIPKEIISLILKNENFDKIILSSENDFSFKINKKYKISDLIIKSKVNLDEANFNLKNKLIKNYIPDFEDKFKFTDHILDIEHVTGRKYIIVKEVVKLELLIKKKKK